MLGEGCLHLHVEDFAPRLTHARPPPIRLWACAVADLSFHSASGARLRGGHPFGLGFEQCSQHHPVPEAASAIGEALVLAALLGSALQFEGS